MSALLCCSSQTCLSGLGPSPAIAVPQQRIASLWGTTFATRATGSATTIIRAAIGNAKHEGFNDGAKPTANAVAAWLGHAGQRSRRAVWAVVVEKARLLDALCSSAPGTYPLASVTPSGGIGGACSGESRTIFSNGFGPQRSAAALPLLALLLQLLKSGRRPRLGQPAVSKVFLR